MKYAVLFTGTAGVTERVAVTDVAQLLINLLTVDAGRSISGVLITCEDFNARFAFNGSVPTQGANPVGHVLFANQSLKLINSQVVRTFRVINAVAMSDAFLQVTLEYEI